MNEQISYIYIFAQIKMAKYDIGYSSCEVFCSGSAQFKEDFDMPIHFLTCCS